MAAPNPPSQLTAVANGGYTSINLTWRINSTGEDGFKIERSANGVSGWSQIDTTSTGVNYYQNTGLSAGATWYYRVRAYSGVDNSSYTNVASATVFDIDDVGTPYLFLDPGQGVYSDAGITPAGDNDTVQEWHDQSGNNYDVTQTTSGDNPTLQTNEINGLPVIRFDGSDFLVADSAADWKFLHDGSAFTVFVVWKTSTDEPDALYTLLDTGALSSTDIGFCYFYDDRSSQTQYHKMRSWISRGAGSGIFEAEAQTRHEGVRGGRWHVSCTHRASSSGDLYVENDGHWGGDGSDSADGSPSSSNPTSALTVGARYNDSFHLTGDIAYILIYSSDLSTSNRRKVTQYLGEKFNQPEYLFFDPATLIVDATSEATYDYASLGGLAIAGNGDLILAYAVGTAHVLSNREYLYISRSRDKGVSWSSPQELWSTTNDGGGTDFYEPQGLTVLSDGRILLKCGKCVSGVVVNDGNAYFESFNDGRKWYGPTDIAGSGTGHDWGGGGPILELANGNYLFPYRYWDTGDAATLWSVALRYSTDDGDSWSALSDIAEGYYDEPGVIQLSGGNVIGMWRDEGSTPRSIRYKVSADNGSTWGTSTYACLGYGPCMPFLTEDNDIIVHIRHPLTYYSRAWATVLHMLGTDLDRAQKGHIFELSPNDTGAGQPMYGQFVQDIDGTIYCAYGTETTENGSCDIMFAKAVRARGEYTYTSTKPGFIGQYKGWK